MRVRHDRDAAREHAEHRVDDLGIPLRSAAVLEHLQRLARRNRLTIRPLADHRVEGVGYRDDTRLEGNARAIEAVRIPGAVVALMMRTHDDCTTLQRGNLTEDPSPG